MATSALLALGFPHPSVWPLAFIALAPLLLWSEHRQYKHAFIGGAAAGLVFYLIVFSWFATLTYWVGSIVILGVALLFFFFSLFWGLVVVGDLFLAKWLPAARVVALPSMWILMEYVHNHIFTGFGWGSVGYTQWNNPPVAQLASVGSVYAVSFYVVLINALICFTIRHAKRPRVVILSSLAIIVLGVAVPAWGKMRMRSPDMSSSLCVGVVQPNFSLDVKWSPEYSEHMFRMLEFQTELAAAKGAELIVWPESAFQGYLVDEIRRIGKMVKSHKVYLLTGSNHWEGATATSPDQIIYYNSAFLVNPKGKKLGRYDKRHLAPFGEYVPFQKLLPFVGKIVPAVADFSPGTSEVTPFSVKGTNFCVLICFENSFPHLVRKTALLDADFLVQLTNDGWFGRSAQPEQDLAVAVFRAIENGATLVRGTNTGISCFIDPWGRVSGVVTSPYGETVFTRGIAVETISTVAHDTFYKTYGDVWVLGCAALFAATLGPALYRRKKADAEEGNGEGKKLEAESDSAEEEREAPSKSQ